MAWIVTAVVAVGAGTAVYTADQQRKSTNRQRDSLLAAQAEDARKAAEAEAGAQVAANAKTAEAKRRRRSSSLLASGGGVAQTDTLGGAPTPMSSGGT